MKNKLKLLNFVGYLFLFSCFCSCSCYEFKYDYNNDIIYSTDGAQITDLRINKINENKRYIGVAFNFELDNGNNGNDTIFLTKENPGYQIYKSVGRNTYNDILFYYEPNTIYQIEILPQGDCAGEEFILKTDNNSKVIVPNGTY